MADEKRLDKIKSGVFSRGLALAKLTLNTSAHLAGHGAATLLSNSDVKSEKWKAFLKGRALEFSSELGELKGSLMKAGQMLSMYGEHFLPPEANELLKSLQSQSPPLAWSAIEPVIKANLSPEKIALLEIDKEAIGSASLGQVHRATIKATGEQIVLKVQYPGVDRAIDSDLKAIKSFLSLLKVLPRGVSTDHIFAEVREMLVQEMNYELEAKETKLYGERLKGDSRYIVPKVYDEFCGPRVIATSFEKGLAPDDKLVSSLSQERRNRLAESFLDLYLTELFDWGIVQTDPHLGNYRVRLSPTGEDQLILLDFGAVRAYPDDFLIPYRRMVRAALINDPEQLRAEALNLKFLDKTDSTALVSLFEQFCFGMVEPFQEKAGDYDWKKSDLPQRLTKIALQILQKFPLRTPPREILFLDRKTGGVFIFLSVLGAKMNGAKLLAKKLRL